MNDLSWLLACVKQAADRSTDFMAAFSVAVGHSRSAKYSHQNASGHLSLLPTAMGTMCAAFSLASSVWSSASVVGGVLIPARANRSFRYQNPTVCRS